MVESLVNRYGYFERVNLFQSYFWGSGKRKESTTIPPFHGRKYGVWIDIEQCFRSAMKSNNKCNLHYIYFYNNWGTKRISHTPIDKFLDSCIVQHFTLVLNWDPSIPVFDLFDWCTNVADIL